MKPVADEPGEARLQAYVDGRLAEVERAEVARLLAADPALAERVGAYMAQRDLLRDRLVAAADSAIPDRLRVSAIAARSSSPRRFGTTALATGMAASLAIGIGIGALGIGSGPPTGTTEAPERPMAAALVAHRIFAADRRHPVEVGADEEAHLVQWLSRRLGRPLSAPDLASRGYRLIGGRLLPAAAGPAAQFMYEDGAGRRLTLYVHAAGGRGGTEFMATGEGALQAIYWYDEGWGYAVAAEADRATLLGAARDIYHQLAV